MIATVSMTAPVAAGGADKLEVEKIPQGFQLCTLYGISDLQTQNSGEYGPKHKIGLMFEFPQQLRVFYEGDPAKPSASYLERTRSMHEKASLRALVKGMMGRGMTDKEAETFDLTSLLGKSFVANIVHSVDGKYANIDTLSPLTEQSCKMFGLNTPSDASRINDLFFWDGSQGYQSENFKSLPNFIRDKIKESVEGKTHAASGGTFAEPEPREGSSSNQNVPAKKKLIMIDKQYTYEQYAQTWTDEQLVAAGHARWDEPVTPPTPVPSSPQGPGPSAPAPAPQQVSSAPAPVPPVTPTPPSVPPVKKVMVMKNGSNPQDWYDGGWTDEQIIAEGHGSFQ